MKKYVVFLLVINLFVFSCNRKGNFFTLSLEKDTVLTKRGYHPQFINDTTVYSYFYYRKSLILISNLQTSGIDSIKLPYKFYFAMPVGDTEIFIKLLVHYYNNADSSLRFIDFLGNTKKILNLKGSPFYTSENKGKQKINLGYANSFTLLNGKLFIGIKRNTGPYPLNSKELINSNVPIVGYIDLQNNKYHNLPIYDYPNVDTNAAPYADMWGEPFVSTTLDQKSLIISFNYTPLFYIYNPEKNTIKKHYVPSLLIDTLNPTIYSFYPRYLNFLSVKKSDFYFRLVQYSARKNGLIIMDKRLNHIGEVVLPDNFLPHQIIDNKLLGTDITSKNVIIYKFNLHKIDTSDFITQNKDLKNLIFKLMSSCPVSYGKINIPDSVFINYLSHFYNDTDYNVIIIPLMASCGSCVKEVLYLYNFNKKAFNKLNIKLLLYASTYSFIKNYVESLAPVKVKEFKIDTNFYPYYFGSLSNITFVEIKNKKLVFKRNYPASAIDSIYYDIVNLYKPNEN